MDTPADASQDTAASDTASNGRQERQCRICFDGEDSSLGRLIRPCLCKGSITVRYSQYALMRWTDHNGSVCPCQVLTEVAHVFPISDGLLQMSTVRLSI
jgi:E3 ubiquitin-protein ligase DOA10